MDETSTFDQVGFDLSMRTGFYRLASFITGEDCKARLYKPKNMFEARAALHGPGEHRKKARGVFLRAEKRRGGILLSATCGPSWSTLVTPEFDKWAELENKIKEAWMFAKEPRKLLPERDFGDGVTLPAGRPESNRAKF